MKLKTTSVALIVALVLLIVIFAPFATIWSLNTLFPVLAIPYSIETWLAVIVLSAALRTNVTTKKD